MHRPFLNPRQRAAYIMMAIALGFSVALHCALGYTGDKNWLLLATRMMLTGKKLYVDIAETNPPLILWIYALPVSIAMHTKFIRDYQALMLFAFVMLDIVVFVTVRLLKHHPVFAGNSRKFAQFLGLFALIFIVLTNPVYFFDRDYIALLFTLPYMLRFTPSLARAPFPLGLRMATGILAAIGFCMKPHCLILWAGLQLLYIWRERTARILLSVENSIIYAFAALYLLAIGYFAPHYYTDILPLLLASYSGYYRPGTALFFFCAAWFTFALTFIDFRRRYTSPYRGDILYLLAVCGCWLGYALLGNGWGYTYNPLITMLQFVSGWVLWEYCYLAREYAAKGLPVRSFIQGARACMAGFVFAAIGSVMIFTHSSSWQCDLRHDCADINGIANIMKASHATSFGTLIMDFHMNARIADATGATLQTRFHHLWMLPAFLRSDDVTRSHRWVLETVSRDLADDLNHNQPQMMIVDNSPEFYYTGRQVDIAALLSGYANFAQAWRHYRLLRTVNNCSGTGKATGCKFDIYERKAGL